MTTLIDLLDNRASVEVAVVGAGAVGRAFAHALCAASFQVVAVGSTTGASAAALCATLANGAQALALSKAGDASIMATQQPMPGVRMVVVAVADAALCPVLVRNLATAFPEACVALHTSGARGADALAGAASHVLAFHPAAPFPGQRLPLSSSPTLLDGRAHLDGMFAALEGSNIAVAFGERLATMLGMRPFRLRSTVDGKLLYHAACCMASNYTTATLCAAVHTIVASSDLSVHQATELAADLARRSIEAVQSCTLEGSQPVFGLTGPIVRGDAQIVKDHLVALRNSSAIDCYVENVYRGMGAATLQLVQSSARLDAALVNDLQCVFDSQNN